MLSYGETGRRVTVRGNGTHLAPLRGESLELTCTSTNRSLRWCAEFHGMQRPRRQDLEVHKFMHR